MDYSPVRAPAKEWILFVTVEIGADPCFQICLVILREAHTQEGFRLIRIHKPSTAQVLVDEQRHARTFGPDVRRARSPES